MVMEMLSLLYEHKLHGCGIGLQSCKMLLLEQLEQETNAVISLCYLQFSTQKKTFIFLKLMHRGGSIKETGGKYD